MLEDGRPMSPWQTKSRDGISVLHIRRCASTFCRAPQSIFLTVIVLSGYFCVGINNPAYPTLIKKTAELQMQAASFPTLFHSSSQNWVCNLCLKELNSSPFACPGLIPAWYWEKRICRQYTRWCFLSQTNLRCVLVIFFPDQWEKQLVIKGPAEDWGLSVRTANYCRCLSGH